MKRVLVVAFTLHSLSLGKDSWFGPDKAKHFFLGAFAQSAAFSGLRAAGLQKPASLVAASALTIGAAVGKELRDRTGKGTPSVRDVVWGLAGAATVSPLLMKTK
jgi:putative lipoprotein